MEFSDYITTGSCAKGTYCDENYMRYVGWSENTAVQYLFSKKVVDFISQTVSDVLDRVDAKGRRIIVPDDKICHVISSCYMNSQRPPVGDIFTRYNIPPEEPSDIYNEIIRRTIEIITSTVRNELEMEAHNEQLSVWDTVLGDFNKQGLRSHSQIKIRDRIPNPREFNMNY
jgi:hypothetical protein